MRTIRVIATVLFSQAFLPLSGLSAQSAEAGSRPTTGVAADIILTGARVWTGDDANPWAEAIAVRGDWIMAVGSAVEMARHRADHTTVVELAGTFITPGFIDNHTHFNSAGALLVGVNLLDVADEESLVRSVSEADLRLPEGAWILGGDWGAYEEWGMGSAGEEERDAWQPFLPHRSMIDPVTPDRHVLLSKWDRSLYLANALALEASGLTCTAEGVHCDAGSPTGVLEPVAAAVVRSVVPPKSMEQRLIEARAALARLRENGVTTFHDITPPEQMEVFQRLLAGGELTARVYARPTLDKWEALRAAGIKHGFGNEWLKIGGLKGFVDGIMGNSSARFYEPYLTSGELGIWRTMMNPPGNMRKLLMGADSAGHWPQVHAIGDFAIDTLISMFEDVIATNGPRERRFRIIHTQVLRGPEVADRMAEHGLIAEVQPYHAIDDMRWMEERIGDRARWSYAFKTLHDAGVLLSFGSDWPGTNAAWYPAKPILGIYAAVTRQTLTGEPAGGWYPEERIDVETALRAYTVNNAWVAHEEGSKGSLTPGKLADLVVLSADPFQVAPSAIKDIRVLITMVGGKVVFRRETT
jgi:predicted amidohydrolase YtcJ